MRAHISERGYVLATPVAGPELLLVWIAEPRAVTETLHRGTAELAAVLAAQVPSLADAVTAAELAPRTVSHQIVRPKRWAQDNLVLVGDSAHGLHAMGGQGLNTSLQDAVCTAVALDKKLRSGDDSALRDFHAVRRPFIEAFQDQQRRRASGQHDLPLLDLDTLALGQPELRMSSMPLRRCSRPRLPGSRVKINGQFLVAGRLFSAHRLLRPAPADVAGVA